MNGPGIYKIVGAYAQTSYNMVRSETVQGGGTNKISLPYNMNLMQDVSGTMHVNDARALMGNITYTGSPAVTCPKVAWWDPNHGTWAYIGVGTPFTLVPGRGYRVTISGNTTWSCPTTMPNP